MLDQTNELSDYLRSEKEAILANWCIYAKRGSSSGRLSELSYEEFLDDVPYLLSVFCGYLEDFESGAALNEAMEVIHRHGRERWKQDFNLEELLRDWGSLNQAVIEAVNRFYDESTPSVGEGRADAIRKTGVFFIEASCAGAARFGELQRSEASERIRELEQMRRYFEQIGEARQQLLSDFSHDIGGSLTAISGVSEILKNGIETDDGSASSEFVGIIDDSVVAATKVLDTLLQLTNFDAGRVEFKAEPVRVGEFLDECVKALAPEQGAQVSLKLEPSAGFEVMADPANLRRTLEVMLDYAKANACHGSMQFICRREANTWTLEFRFRKNRPDEADDHSTKEHRRELDQLLLKRFCLIQKASCEIRDEGGDEVVISVRFPG